MNKVLKKITVVFTTCAVICGTLLSSSCARSSSDDPDDFTEEVDPARTQLYVGNYNGGLGWTWLQKAKELFETENPDVQIMIDNGKDEYSYTTLKDTMTTNRQDMYILDDMEYYTFVRLGHFMDITDLVVDGGEASLENRMNATLRDYYKTPDAKYYAIPSYESFYHMIYDVDLFDEYCLWLNEDGTDFVEDIEEKRYPGISGEEGAWDEGLPRTYSQFFKLLDKMVEYGITPVTWAGAVKDTYLPLYLKTVWADYCGKSYSVNYSYNGDIRIINNYDFTEPSSGTFSLATENYETVRVTKENARTTLPKQAGKYYALKFAKDLTGNGYKYLQRNKVNSPNESHTLAQDTFLRSRYLKESRGSKPIAMLIDGGWWYNEAQTVFNAMEEYGEEWGSKARRLGVMPIPKADDGSSAAGRTISALGTSCMVISNYTKKADIAKKFFKFINTEKIMKLFTEYTLLKRPYDYQLDDEQLKKLPYYTQNLLQCLESADVEYCVPRVNYLHNNMYNLVHNMSFNSKFDNYEYFNPLINFFERPNITAQTYFKGLLTFQADHNYTLPE